MRVARRAVVGLCAVALLIPVLGATFAADADEDQVRAVLNEYFAGHATGDGAHYKKIFHPNSKLYFIRDGKYSERTSAEYIAGASGRPAADEAKRKRTIASIDIAGDAASAKLVLQYPDVKFTDYMSLLKVDGEWKIVAKTFHAERKAP
jgi:hypothetical protein